MNATHWQKRNDLLLYLEERKTKGVTAFTQLLQNANAKSAELVVITFTYENLEVLLKIDNQFQLDQSLFGTINRYEIDDLLTHDYEEDNAFKDFAYTQLLSSAIQLTQYWVANCYHQAAQKIKPTIPIYFKHNHDDMEVFDLIRFKTMYEKSEFETFVRNNQMNLVTLFG